MINLAYLNEDKRTGEDSVGADPGKTRVVVLFVKMLLKPRDSISGSVDMCTTQYSVAQSSFYNSTFPVIRA